MNRRVASLVLGVLFTVAAVAAMRGTAGATSVQGAINFEGFEIWQFQCTSSLTHCMQVSVCDDQAGSSDMWEVSLGVYSPATLLGQGGSEAAHTGECSYPVYVCRPGVTHGAMKALVSVNHPVGVGLHAYDLHGYCSDAHGNILPAAGTKLDIKGF